MKYATGPTDTAIVEYGMKFTELKVALLDHATINTEIIVLRALDVVDRIGMNVWLPCDRILTSSPRNQGRSP